MTTMVDRVLAAAGLVVAAPVLAVAAAFIAAEDGFPVFFRQKRIGRHGVPFTILKLRSMRRAGGPQITAASDPRVTRAGKILRKYKLDELPQLWNVVAGEMSFIGPRPEVPTYVSSGDPAWRDVLSVRPGITDFATLVYRNEETLLAQAADPELYYRTTILPAKLRLNTQYLERRSWWSDVKLILLTVRYSFWPQAFEQERVKRALSVQ